MQYQVSDTASNRRDQIANFAEILRAPSRRIVFAAVYWGKKRSKTVEEVADATGLTAKRVTEIAKPLALGEKLFEQDRLRIDGKVHTIYRKLHFVETNKKKILQLAKSKKKLSTYHTKTNPAVAFRTGKVTIRVPFKIKIRQVRIDEVDQFIRVRKIKTASRAATTQRLSEARVKAGILKLLRESRNPKDWGGESNDIFTTRLRLNGHSRNAAFALKGPAKKGILVPAKMGKNGDQVQRLFDSPAEVFFVQYEGEIAESVIKLMQNLATAKSLLHKEVFYGIIDGEDTYRLRLAYPKAFN